MRHLLKGQYQAKIAAGVSVTRWIGITGRMAERREPRHISDRRRVLPQAAIAWRRHVEANPRLGRSLGPGEVLGWFRPGAPRLGLPAAGVAP
jgi:hypothetical protein